MNNQEQAQLKALDAFMRKQLGQDESGHDTGHIDRVVQLAQHLLESEPTADAFITLAAATLHDTYDDKLFADVAHAKQQVADKMSELQIADERQTAIFQIIDNMSWSKQRFGNPEPLDISGQIVQDADRLEAIGMIAVARVIQYGVQAHHALYDPSIPPRDLKTKADYRNPAGETMINHFDEKLFLLKDYLNTDEGKRIGAIRDAAMHQFVDQFKAEWAGTDYA
ncbi:HD domain-containing protein [Weissella viridescens]|uniref:HD domain-containing protein n=1 Tax=Weissella viridescens TaxID=1629 RepID=A0A3P2RLG5_WEIVI|nr:HD domain-containing protein [Weissella viridescens]RRG18512.1 HD domain-containing protein [Weissella viridescens]